MLQGCHRASEQAGWGIGVPHLPCTPRLGWVSGEVLVCRTWMAGGDPRGLEGTGLESEMMLTNRRNGLKTIRSDSKGQAQRSGLGRGAEEPRQRAAVVSASPNVTPGTAPAGCMPRAGG